MDASALIPAADSIPAAPGLFRLLLDLTFAVHILLVNAMFGLTMIGLLRSFRPGHGLGRVAGLVPNVTALAVNIGVAPLLFLQVLYGQFLYVSSTLMGVYWVGLVLAVMAAYGLAYRQKYALHAGRGPGGAAWACMALLMVYATLVQTHNAVLLSRPELWAGYFDNPSGTMAAWGDATLIPRWLHFVVASAAVGGLCLAMIGHGRAKRSNDPDGPALKAEGLALFGWATVVQALVGLWWLLALPQNVLGAFLGGDPAATGHLAAGILAAAVTAALAFKGRLMASAGALALTVALMAAMRGMLRQLYLAPHFDPASLPVTPEPSTVAMFFGCFALSLAVVIWAAKHPKTDPRGTR